MLLDISPLKYRNFRFLFLSQLVSFLGSQMTLVTIPFQVYSLTHSSFETGIVSVIELICLLSTAFLGGALADRFDRRAIVMRSEIIILLLVLLLAFNALLPNLSLWLIYILAGLIAAVNGFHRPAFEALTPLTVPQNELPKISSLLSVKFLTASLLGPAMGGLLVASAGPTYTYLLNGFTFLVSLFFLKLITLANEPIQPLESTSILGEIAEGGRYIYGRKDILASYIVDFLAMVFCMPHVLFPAFAQYYGMNRWLGALYAAIALGGLIASLLSGWTSSIKRLGVAIFCAASGWALSILCAGLMASFAMLLIALFLAGICDGYSGIFRLTMWNESLPNELRGRVSSFSLLSYTSGPLLGNAVMGFLGDSLGLHRALSCGALISLISMIIVLLRLPSFWKYRSLHISTPKSSTSAELVND
jgi:MFS family permease